MKSHLNDSQVPSFQELLDPYKKRKSNYIHSDIKSNKKRSIFIDDNNKNNAIKAYIVVDVDPGNYDKLENIPLVCEIQVHSHRI